MSNNVQRFRPRSAALPTARLALPMRCSMTARKRTGDGRAICQHPASNREVRPPKVEQV